MRTAGFWTKQQSSPHSCMIDRLLMIDIDETHVTIVVSDTIGQPNSLTKGPVDSKNLIQQQHSRSSCNLMHDTSIPAYNC